MKLGYLFFYFAVLFAPSKGFCQWTDPVLTPRTTPVKAVHISELRTQINTKLVACTQPIQVWTDPILTPRITPIKKIHIDELRTATTNLVNAYRISASLAPSPPAYTNAIIAANMTPIKAVHIDELRTYVSGATCVPGCPAQALAWNVGVDACSALAPLTAIGSSAAISDITAPTTGAAQFSCNAGGIWAALPNAGATCSPGMSWHLTSGGPNAGPDTCLLLKGVMAGSVSNGDPCFVFKPLGLCREANEMYNMGCF